MAAVTLSEILRAVGQIEGKLERIRADFDAERIETRANRQRQYERQDDMSNRLTSLESALRINTESTVQTRNKLDLVAPQVAATTRTLRSWKIRGGFAITGAGMLGAALWWLIRTNWQTIWQFITRT